MQVSNPATPDLKGETMNFKTLLALILMIIGTGMMYIFTFLCLLAYGQSDVVAFIWSTAFMGMTIIGDAYLWSKDDRGEMNEERRRLKILLATKDVKIAELEAQNERIKDSMSFTESKALDRVASLEAQVEKMKNCDNCSRDQGGTLRIGSEECWNCNNCDKWEARK